MAFLGKSESKFAFLYSKSGNKTVLPQMNHELNTLSNWFAPSEMVENVAKQNLCSIQQKFKISDTSDYI